jgi:hypothetical protein
MTVLVILPKRSVGADLVRFWKRRLTAADRLHILSFGSGGSETIHGCPVHYLELDGSGTRFSRSHVIRGIGWRLVWREIGLWGRYLSNIWSELLWTVRAYDPDVIDVRALPNPAILRERLGDTPWHVVASSEEVPSSAPSPWREYDATRKVSIVLPVHNGEAYLRQSIESCLDQTHGNIELVIVDDCSTDASSVIIDDYRRRDPRVVAIRNARNRRLPGALNVGFEAASGDLLSWTSHDNYYAPTAIAALVESLCTWKDIDLAYAAFRIMDGAGRVDPKVYYRSPPWRLVSDCVVGACFLYTRALYKRVGQYREDLEYSEDYEYWVRAYKAGFKMMALPEPLYHYRRHAQSMTSRADNMPSKPHSGDRVRREHFALAGSSH